MVNDMLWWRWKRRENKIENNRGNSYLVRMIQFQAYLLTIETNRWQCVDVLIELEPVQCSGLARRVQAHHGDVQCGEEGK